MVSWLGFLMADWGLSWNVGAVFRGGELGMAEDVRRGVCGLGGVQTMAPCVFHVSIVGNVAEWDPIPMV